MSVPDRGGAQLVIRVWVEPHDPVIRGQVIRVDVAAPGEAIESKAARGLDGLLGVVRELLSVAEADLLAGTRSSGARGDAAATEQ